MISLTRLATWRLRLRRLCGLSLTPLSSRLRNSGCAAQKPQKTVVVEMDQKSAMRDFVERVDRFVEGGFSEVNMDFAKLRGIQDEFQLENEYSMSDGLSCVLQNRYRDVVPYNKNRIKLKDREAPDNDYINASLIEYPDVERKYIAAQAPLPNTIDDFWHMIGQNNVKVVVMLCKTVENSMSKCVQYFPENVGDTMDITHGVLETIKEEKFDEFSVRELKFVHSKFGESIIYQLHYTEWPDHGCPNGLDQVFRFVELMDECQLKYAQDKSPLLLHCSAGCGRTGTVVGVDIFRTLIRENKINSKIDLQEFVLTLRKQRTAFVQSASQYQLLHKLVAHYCKLALETEESEKEEAKCAANEPDVDMNENNESDQHLEEEETVNVRL
ncbi:unnamed protein product [Bursaphelenchus xylophilus]|uniref:protein-tyrosine-phosphatase n=1 Tax=Bursaphelenchus xylophilus TaxID=6326 RepID=A0A1I7S3S2_BURXY|nr:unnamed protein product [Bursaphelenchus xylophilus]CAG9116492.1 unnamed protein product [Bursaphelenchus xylophilus]